MSDADRLFRLDLVLSAVPGDAEAREIQAELLQARLAAHWELGWEEMHDQRGQVFRLHHHEAAALEAAERQLREIAPDMTTQFAEVLDRNWAMAWRDYFEAVLCGEDFVVVAPWLLTAEHPWAGRKIIVVEPKMAFGTGHHPTTAMCLEILSDLHRQGRLRPEFSFLDVGCGSGILGVGCALLGGRGTGLDNDPLAVENGLENVTLNKVADRLDILPGDLAHLEDAVGEGAFDVVLANILAEPLIQFAPAIAGRVAPGGVLILSGLLALQIEAVREAYLDLGLPQPEVRVEGEWAALLWA